MPTYSFQCNTCFNTYDIEQKITQDLIAPVCTMCNTSMVRLWSSPTVVFNAPGFYSTGG